MGFEIDFLAVGEGARSGDAIALRWGNLFGPRDQQFVMVVDGGNKDSGAALVSHIEGYYGTSDVDLVVNTHPDADHASGLSVVLEELTVKKLWMHLPWNRLEHIHDLVQDGRITHDSLQARIEEALEAAHALEEIAEEKGIPIWEPFTSAPMARGGATIRVLGPRETYYTELLPQFDDMPELQESAVASYSEGPYRFSKSAAVTNSAQIWIDETLEDPDEELVRAENNSSVILLIQVDGEQICAEFVTAADAGVPALTYAFRRAVSLGIDLRRCCFYQVPHHGSRRNIGPSILDAIVGPKLPFGSASKATAYVSVAPEAGPKHPSAKVTNAFRRRGVQVVATKGNTLRYSQNAPQRYGWVAASALPLLTERTEE
jgi:beta-lactamase superfamily II metal-dependent hydrolase